MSPKGRPVFAVVGLAVLATWGASAIAMATPSNAPKGNDGLPVFGPGADYHPTIVPSNFSANVDNPYFPLRPGTTLIYAGTKDGKRALDIHASDDYAQDPSIELGASSCSHNPHTTSSVP